MAASSPAASLLSNSGAPPTAKRRPPPPAQRPGSLKKAKTKRERNMAAGSTDDVLHLDILALRNSSKRAPIVDTTAPSPTAGSEPDSLPEPGSETEVHVLDISSTGDGLAMRPGSDNIYVVPFTVPGDVATVKVFRHLQASQQGQTVADFVSIAKPSPLRDDSRIRCRYFASCGGCQFQMLDYSEQLKFKKRVLEKAYRNFSSLTPDVVPPVGDTIGSPLQYGYRTKLTPHFDAPPGSRPGRRGGSGARFEACPDIGFMRKGRRAVLDIEDCPIGTQVIRLGMARERKRMQSQYGSYQRGATILLRESTQRFPDGGPKAPPDSGPEAPPDSSNLPPKSTITSQGDGYVDVKTCETDSKATITEYVGPHVFTNPAGSFFQNNNSFLPVFTSYVKQHILPPSSSPDSVKYLIDAYSGSGLFTIVLASLFQHSTGIDIAADSIASARRNAALNGLGDDRCSFIAADAAHLFQNVTYPPDETVVVLDPPRKGCDAGFLAQLRSFGPKRIVYVSCNVHTQARDVGDLVRGHGQGPRYDIESLVGFDFFPQTSHVEGVAVLNRHDPGQLEE